MYQGLRADIAMAKPDGERMSIEVPPSSSSSSAMPGLSSRSPHPTSTHGHNQRKYPTEPARGSDMTGPQLLWKVQNRANQDPMKLYHPYDVKFIGSDLCVVEGFWPNSRIQIFNCQGKSKLRFAQGQVLPFGVTLTQQGHIAVTDHHERTVKFFNVNGEALGSWEADCFSWPNGIAANQHGHLIIADWSAGLLSVNDVDGQTLHTIRTSINNNSNCSCPQYVTVDSHQRIIATDSYDHSVKVYSPDGDLLRQFGQQDTSVICDPRGIITDGRDNIVVSDWGGNRVRVFSADGAFLQDILTAQHVQNPWGIALGENGQLALTEQKLNASPALKMFT